MKTTPMEDDLKILKVEYLSKQCMFCVLRVLRGKLMENSDEISSVALLSPSCLVPFCSSLFLLFPFLFLPPTIPFSISFFPFLSFAVSCSLWFPLASSCSSFVLSCSPLGILALFWSILLSSALSLCCSLYCSTALLYSSFISLYCSPSISLVPFSISFSFLITKT